MEELDKLQTIVEQICEIGSPATMQIWVDRIAQLDTLQDEGTISDEEKAELGRLVERMQQVVVLYEKAEEIGAELYPYNPPAWITKSKCYTADQCREAVSEFWRVGFDNMSDLNKAVWKWLDEWKPDGRTKREERDL